MIETIGIEPNKQRHCTICDHYYTYHKITAKKLVCPHCQIKCQNPEFIGGK